MESIVGNDKYFKVNPKISREPGKICKNGCNMTNLGERVTPAAEFCTRCRCLITTLGKPYSKKLQQPSFDVTSA